MRSRRLAPVSERPAVSEGPPFLVGVRGARGGAIGGFGVVNGPRSSSSLQCGHNSCEIMLAASEMVSPLVSEGAVVSEGQYTASGSFGVVNGPRSSSFFALRMQCLGPLVSEGAVVSKRPLMHCVRNAWPPVSEVAVVLEALM